VKIIIEGKEYDLTAALQRPTLFLVREMKIRTGYGMKSLKEQSERFKGLTEDDFLEDADLMGAFMAMIWLARRTAGENLSLEAANSFDFNEMQWAPDEPAIAPADPAAELPKAETVSNPDAEPLPAAAEPAPEPLTT